MGADYPLSVLVTRPSAKSQRWFANEAIQEAQSLGVQVEAQDDGLLLRGTTELQIERACHALAQRYSDLKFHNPHVHYPTGKPLEEPFYRMKVITPEATMGDVMRDLSSRRGLITAVDDLPSGKQVTVEIPVGECFGYSTTLRMLTRGQGNFEVEFIGYRPYSGPGNGGPVVA